MSTYATPDTTTESLLERAKRCFKLASEAYQRQRDRESEDLRFQVPDLQWDSASRAQRSGSNAGGVATPPRPILSISKLDQPIQLVLNTARAAKLGVSIHPVSETADDDTAEVMQGIYNRIQRDSKAEDARLWALDRAVKAGRGAYRVNTRWDEDAPETFDQEIVIERILLQEMVYFDPAAQRSDFSDGEYAFVAAWVQLDTFKRLYPNATFSKADGGEFADLAGADPEWVRGDGDSKAVLVTEYFYKVHDTETVDIGGRVRERDKVSVRWCKVTCHEVLEEQDWNGRYIPIIPVIGRELQPFDSERRWVGMIGPSKDGQKLYNFAASSLVERMMLEPKVPYLIAEGQIEGYEPEWQQANVRNLPYLPYKPTTLGGAPVPPPQRMQIDQSGMSLAMMALQESDSFMQATTMVNAWSKGQANRNESGRKVLALQQQTDEGTSHWVSNLADAVALEAKIVLDLMPAIYDRPGRVARIIGDEDDTKTVMLNASFVMGQNGRPQPAQDGQQGAKRYDLRGGGYTTSVSIGKSFQTRLQQGAEEFGVLLQAMPPELQVLLLPTYMRFRDTPGAKEAADVLAKYRDSKFPGLVDDKDGTPTPEQLQAQLQAMQQQAQLMQAQLQQAMQAIQTDQAKQQAMLQKAEMDAQAKVEVARMQQEAAARDDALKLQLERMNQQFEAVQAQLDRAHKAQLAREEMAHEVAMAEVAARQAQRQQQTEGATE